MNYNANTGGGRQAPSTGIGKKIKRISDTNAMGAALPAPQFGQPNQFGQQQHFIQQSLPGSFEDHASTNSFNPQTLFQSQVPQSQQQQHQQQQQQQHQQQQQQQHHQQQQPYSMYSAGPATNQHQYGQISNSNMPPQFAVFQQPIVQDMALQYGQKLADQGKQLVENQFEKWVPVTRLKYYFSVDNKYVINKLRLLFFPFTHKDWSLKFDQENPVQPRFDINAPDLYIPTMAYITYVVLAGLMLGMQNRFSPEQLGIQASSALAYSIFELIVYTITMYIANIPANLRTLDLVAFSGYKFVIINACISVSILFYSSGYYIALIYTSLSLGFFLLRTLKTKVLNDANAQTASGINYDPYGNSQPNSTQFDYSVGRKRKLYFLFLVVCVQAFLSFWLSKHLILREAASNIEKIINPEINKSL